MPLALYSLRCALRLLLAVAWVGALAPSAASAGAKSYYHTDIEGWPIEVSTDLLDRDPWAARQGLHLLRTQLAGIARIMPGAPLAELRHVPIRLAHAGIDSLIYHMASATDAAVATGDFIEIASARFFIRSSDQKPWAVLHELAHAFHERVLGRANPTIRQAYRNALAQHLYERVPHHDGRLARAYALTSEREYFAELTEAYFGRNDTFPFTRDELRFYDPVGLAMVRTLWGAL